MRRTSFVLLSLLCASAASAEEAARFPGVASVTAVGTAREIVAEDRATVHFVVKASGKSVEEVAPDLARRAQKLVEALRALGLPDQTLKSSGPTLQDVYATYRDANGLEVTDRRRKTSVDGRYAVRVRIDPIGRVAAVLKAGTEAGALAEGVTFSIEDAPAIRERLRIAAARDAVERVRALAAAVGARPGRILTVADPESRWSRENADLYPPRPITGDIEITFPILPGEQELSERIEVQLELLQP